MEPQAKLDPITEIALRSMKDVAVPPPVSWMPQTWGCALLAVLLALALAIWLALALRRYRRNAYRREALRLLEDIGVKLHQSESRGTALHQLGELLKRTALAAWPRERIAQASGQNWVHFLDDSQKQSIGPALRRFLDDGEYRAGNAVTNRPPSEADELIQDTRRWIEGHHVST
ncbi:DUF4381 domain-containing protein [Neorhizobium sp. P12A]|uniref:DUF4381 domain-containing protein n=1 Tax=Neorhizobium sp. P12A TaxID=2268027 RepID=UPI0011EF0E6F|nr:DUF4381 domain-containing protein [Neorhizobium sp. P12A]KAA0694408.1 DUF4381 domain-containing protein [Neorhizobium sp. P12A]